MSITERDMFIKRAAADLRMAQESVRALLVYTVQHPYEDDNRTSQTVGHLQATSRVIEALDLGVSA